VKGISQSKVIIKRNLEGNVRVELRTEKLKFPAHHFTKSKKNKKKKKKQKKKKKNQKK